MKVHKGMCIKQCYATYHCRYLLTDANDHASEVVKKM